MIAKFLSMEGCEQRNVEKRKQHRNEVKKVSLVIKSIRSDLIHSLHTARKFANTEVAGLFATFSQMPACLAKALCTQKIKIIIKVLKILS